MDSPDHPLEFLIGTWTGQGRGYYPNIRSFSFFEEVTFTKDPAGRPVVQYSQKTNRAIVLDQEEVRGPPLHAESGFIRIPGWSKERCELILSQPTGVASVEIGSIQGNTVEWASTSIVRSPSAKEPYVTEFSRTWKVNPTTGTLTYSFSMATDSTTLQPHLEAILHRVES